MGTATFLLFLLAHLSLAQALPSPAVASGASGRLAGRVLSLTGQPVPRANVRLSPNDVSTSADDQGKFIFDNVVPGRYTLTAEKAGFLRPNRQRTPLLTLTLAAGSELENLVVQLTPQAVIVGRITDDSGDPIPNATITPMRYEYLRGRRELTSAGPSAQADDQGNYRLGSLAPGRYYLRITNPRPAEPRAVSQPTSETNVTTYYPNALDVAAAKALEVMAGAELRGIDIRIRRVKVYTVAGNAVNLVTGTAPVGSMLDLIPKGAQQSMSGIPNASVTEVRPDGSFEFRNVQPGLYDLFSEPGGVSPTGEALTPLAVHAEVAVLSNVTGVRISPRPLAPIMGITVMEDGSKPPVLPVARFIPFEGAPASPTMMSLQTDGTLQIRAGASKYMWSVGGLPDGVYVNSVTFAGQDITHSPLDNTSGSGGTIRILLSSQAATLTGSVRDEDGRLVPTIIVSLWPKVADTGTFTGGVKQTTTDQNGAFQFTSLPPGEYYIAAWEEIDAGVSQSAEFLARFNAEASAFKFEESAKVSVDANLIRRDRVAAETSNLPE